MENTIQPTPEQSSNSPVEPEHTHHELSTKDHDQLSQELADAEAKLEEMRETMLRERAELENQRKRLVRDVEQARRFANERLLSDLLPVCDNLERGLGIENADVTSLREGMELTLKSLLKVAETHGLKAINPVGEAFNPELHQAVSMVDTPAQAANTVVGVLQKGWVLNERLLRPALVTVAKG